MGALSARLYDVGVAGSTVSSRNHGELLDATVIVVVAGMEGAARQRRRGLVSVPVRRVPTNVGYGASFQGLAPLLTMLNSCAAGVTSSTSTTVRLRVHRCAHLPRGCPKASEGAGRKKR